MTVFDLKDYFEKKIRVITLDGKSFEGILSGFEDALDSSSGKDEIELYVGECYIDIDVPSIEYVKLIGS